MGPVCACVARARTLGKCQQWGVWQASTSKSLVFLRSGGNNETAELWPRMSYMGCRFVVVLFSCGVQIALHLIFRGSSGSQLEISPPPPKS